MQGVLIRLANVVTTIQTHLNLVFGCSSSFPLSCILCNSSYPNWLGLRMSMQCRIPKVSASAADIPLKKAVAGVRVGLLPDLGFVVNPTVQQMEDSKLDLIMAGTDSAVLMIEGYCDFLTEDQMLEVSCANPYMNVTLDRVKLCASSNFT